MWNLRVLLVVPLLACGCATDIPAPRGHLPSEQTKLRAAHHWNLVAADIAQQTRQSLDRIGPGARVYVEPPANASTFELAMHDFISTRLVEAGVAVSPRAAGALEVRYGTRLVAHQSPRRTLNVPMVAVAAGVIAGYNILAHSAAADVLAAGLLAGAIADDVASNRYTTTTTGPSQAELVVTTSVSDGQVFLMRKTDVYYIDDADLSLFLKSRPPVPVREYRITGEKP